MVTYACMPCIFMGGQGQGSFALVIWESIRRGEIRHRRKRDSKVLDAISWHSGMMSALGH